jgi:hypothetical protein
VSAWRVSITNFLFRVAYKLEFASDTGFNRFADILKRLNQKWALELRRFLIRGSSKITL